MKSYHESVPFEQLSKDEKATFFREQILYWVKDAARFGFVVTVEQRSLVPLAMRHHATIVTVRPKFIRPGETE